MCEPTVSPDSLTSLIERVAKIADGELPISNKELIELCKEYAVFESTVDSHIFHEIAETALNSLIQKKYGSELLIKIDPVESVSTILRPLQRRLPTQTWRSETQITYQQFSTPTAIAYLAAHLLNIRPGEIILEPSCGTGSLAVWAEAAGASVIANEIDPRRRVLAQTLGFEPYGFDGEFIDDLLPEHLMPDVVFANPPFSSSAGRVQRNSIDPAITLQAVNRLVCDTGNRTAAVVPIADDSVSFLTVMLDPETDDLDSVYVKAAATFVEHALKLSNGNLRCAARSINTTHSTISRILKKNQERFVAPSNAAASFAAAA